MAILLSYLKQELNKSANIQTDKFLKSNLCVLDRIWFKIALDHLVNVFRTPAKKLLNVKKPFSQYTGQEMIN